MKIPPRLPALFQFPHIERPRRRVWLVLAFVWIVVAGFAIGWWWRARRVAPVQPLRTAIYVWQQHWSPAVVTGLERARGETDCFMIYAGQLTVEEGALRPVYFQPDWSALTRAGRPVVAVVRAGDGLASPLAQGRTGEVAAALGQMGETLAARAAAASCLLTGFQLDYDCPTERLADYAALLEALRPLLARRGPSAPGSAPMLELSFTALPTWLGGRAFARLAHAAAWYVLQVHGVERPTTIDRPIVLCDTPRIRRMAERAARYRMPFYVALPTYGYRVIFDEAGRFSALRAEDDPGDPGAGRRERLALADPVALAGVVADLRRHPPDACMGLAWFRLPIDSDRLNWNWPELHAVNAGRAPRVALRVELRRPEPALAEVWLINEGEANIFNDIACPVHLNGARVKASDVMSGYRQASGDELRGPAPRPGALRLAAWFRLDDKPTTGTTPAQSSISPVQLGEVKIVP